MCIRDSLHFVRALDAHKYNTAHTEVELLADALRGQRGIRRDLVRFDDHRMVQARRWRTFDRSACRQSLHELGEHRQRAIDVSFPVSYTHLEPTRLLSISY